MIFFLSFSERLAISRAAQAAAPAEIPHRIPSRRANFWAVSMACSLVTVMISSMIPVFRTSGTNPAPIPWILWGPPCPPERTGDAAGSK